MKVIGISTFKIETQLKNQIFFYKKNLVVQGIRGIVVLNQHASKNNYVINVSKTFLTFFVKKNVLSPWVNFKSFLKNALEGVNFFFSTKLSLVGVGFRAWSKIINKNPYLILKVGFSNDLKVSVPEYVTVCCLKPTVLLIRGLQKKQVNQFCSIIRSLKKPDVYKGKGIQYINEKIRYKAGKTN